jgi:hypothetical protein
MKLTDLPVLLIGGFEIAIVDATEDLGARMLYGEWRESRSILALREDISNQMQVQTLVHEVCHIISAIYLEGNQLTEQQVAPFAQGLFQLMVDNPILCNTIAAVHDKPDLTDRGSILNTVLEDVSNETNKYVSPINETVHEQPSKTEEYQTYYNYKKI